MRILSLTRLVFIINKMNYKILTLNFKIKKKPLKKSGLSFLRSPVYPWRRANKFCLEAFAWANIEVAAWDKICDLVILLVSLAKSASSILDLAASVLTFNVVRLLIDASNRF